ncbi:MAG TPA: lipocalin-like domain-containing protein [Roseiflexaceae bacterium]|nr:lipocalin-like domain-containing protein [Roseiflexaceae bacterium]
MLTRGRRTIVYRLSSIVFTCLLLSACANTSRQSLPTPAVSAVQSAGGAAGAGFARVTAPRKFAFPQDHGPHQEYAIEWWYYTGNLDAAESRHFGYQLTFFRIGLAPKPAERASDFATSNIYMAHLALTDVANQKFYAFERFSRGAAGLAGAEVQPPSRGLSTGFRIWLEDWSAEGAGSQGLPMRLQAAQDDVAIDLALSGGKPVVIQGDGGVSQTGTGPGKAYYYYSLTHMPTTGAVTSGGQRYDVRGLSWMDHEFGTDALDADAAGWDWFALQLDDGRELMYAQLRAKDGRSGALNMLIETDGSTRALAPAELTLDALGEWQSPRSGGRYPSAWRLRIPSLALDLKLTPYLADQELSLTTVYWEGAVKIAGTSGGQPLGGSGYVELTGYGERQGELQVR